MVWLQGVEMRVVLSMITGARACVCRCSCWDSCVGFVHGCEPGFQLDSLNSASPWLLSRGDLLWELGMMHARTWLSS
ncbi:hypothetical protein DUNSADRAFT_13250 [Dunaliella salina]|uniref:Secreted protein n=1 Tax=Dunaliella salina TaxID=3046 RepID=A0ABQ7H3D7_DUNSA|nr:hypothetical protein DUNSADRAFT_13250 [Dunaliella salina]|eukprot:KAF5841382.1 hypothetical protein DUNSADRAFT_13250 [Dunaliella salina]